MINGLSLFTGIGGLDVALSQYVRPVAYCEIDPYCQSVLLSRMQEGDLPKAPIWDDIRTLPIEELPAIDIILAGFPCQDISVAGNRKGLEGERSGLFFEIMRLAEEIKPTFIFLENVPGITTKGGLRVVREIASLGYDCRWCVISASSVGALHRRERWFMLAYSPGLRCQQRPSKAICKKWKTIKHEKLADISGEGLEQWQKDLSRVCRVSNGVPNQVDRIKALGNAVVPSQARRAFELLTGKPEGNLWRD